MTLVLHLGYISTYTFSEVLRFCGKIIIEQKDRGFNVWIKACIFSIKQPNRKIMSETCTIVCINIAIFVDCVSKFLTSIFCIGILSFYQLSNQSINWSKNRSTINVNGLQCLQQWELREECMKGVGATFLITLSYILFSRNKIYSMANSHVVYFISWKWKYVYQIGQYC